MSVPYFVRNAVEWAVAHRHEFQQAIQAEDAENITHLQECRGCEDCQALMEFYGGCDTCNRWGHKDSLFYSVEEGTYTCPDCAEKEASE